MNRPTVKLVIIMDTIIQKVFFYNMFLIIDGVEQDINDY